MAQRLRVRGVSRRGVDLQCPERRPARADASPIDQKPHARAARRRGVARGAGQRSPTRDQSRRASDGTRSGQTRRPGIALALAAVTLLDRPASTFEMVFFPETSRRGDRRQPDALSGRPVRHERQRPLRQAGAPMSDPDQASLQGSVRERAPGGTASRPGARSLPSTALSELRDVGVEVSSVEILRRDQEDRPGSGLGSDDMDGDHRTRHLGSARGAQQRPTGGSSPSKWRPANDPRRARRCLVPCDRHVASALAPALIQHVQRSMPTEGEVDLRVVGFVQAVWVLGTPSLTRAQLTMVFRSSTRHTRSMTCSTRPRPRRGCVAVRRTSAASHAKGDLQPIRSRPYLFEAREIERHRRDRQRERN